MNAFTITYLRVWVNQISLVLVAKAISCESGGIAMPMDRTKYPADWDEIARAIKEQAGWKCEQCTLQCRYPDEKFDTHRRTLTVAHINHVEMDCRPENLVALCPKCHLAYDQARKVMQRLARKRIKAFADGKMMLF
mgnify:CR=1